MADHENLTLALLAAVNELGVIGKSRTADAGSYSYNYADLEAVVEGNVKPVLAAHGLAVRTPVSGHPDGLAVTVKFIHVSGETLDDDPLPFPRGANAQATGSAITYFRRYALCASLNLTTGDDDDGAAAMARHEPAAPPVPGFRSSLMAATENLTDAERELLRAWLKEEGLPDRPSLMDAEQADRVCEWILHGLPKVGRHLEGDQ